VPNLQQVSSTLPAPIIYIKPDNLRCQQWNYWCINTLTALMINVGERPLKLLSLSFDELNCLIGWLVLLLLLPQPSCRWNATQPQLRLLDRASARRRSAARRYCQINRQRPVYNYDTAPPGYGPDREPGISIGTEYLCSIIGRREYIEDRWLKHI
jgi:hypothetical protein